MTTTTNISYRDLADARDTLTDLGLTVDRTTNPFAPDGVWYTVRDTDGVPLTGNLVSCQFAVFLRGFKAGLNAKEASHE